MHDMLILRNIHPKLLGVLLVKETGAWPRSASSSGIPRPPARGNGKPVPRRRETPAAARDPGTADHVRMLR